MISSGVPDGASRATAVRQRTSREGRFVATTTIETRGCAAAGKVTTLFSREPSPTGGCRCRFKRRFGVVGDPGFEPGTSALSERADRCPLVLATLGSRVSNSRWLSPSIQRCIEHRRADDQAPDEVEGEQQCSGDAESAVGVGAILDET
jgi:hypothetical protein